MSKVPRTRFVLAALAALVPAALATLVFVASVAGGTFPGANGRLAFVATDPTNPANRDIWTMNPDGTDQKDLTANSPARDVLPDWSRDGQKIAFMSTRDGNPEIYVMAADGSNPKRVTNNAAADVDPSWSPNGKTIVFASNRDGVFDLYLVDADGSNLRRLTDNPGFDSQPQFSPTGDKIAFISDRSGAFAVWVMSVDGTAARQLTADSLGAINPGWSPDGKQIAFTDNCCVPENSDLLVMDANGKNVRQLTHDFGNNQRPSWSPDGKKIAFDHGTIDFTTGATSTLDLYVVNSDGTGRVQLTDTPDISELDPDWAVTAVVGAPSALAHRSGFHRWHSCPSDHQGTAARARQPLARSQVYVDASADDAPKAPDIVSVTVADDDSGRLTLTVSVANRPGLLPSDLLVVGLDVDRDRRTGGPMGMDYALSATTAGAELGVWSSSSWSGSGYVRVPGAATLSVSDHSLALSTTVDQLGALMALQRPQLRFLLIAIAGTDQPEQSWADDVAGPWTYQLKLPTKPRARACGCVLRPMQAPRGFDRYGHVGDTVICAHEKGPHLQAF